MNEPLHPLRLTEILDRTAQMYRSRFLVFLGISAIPAATMFVFAAGIFAFFAWIGANVRNGGSSASVLGWILLIVMVILVVPASLAASALGEAAICDAAARFFLGHPMTIRNAYKTAWGRRWRYVGLYIMQGLAIVAGPGIAFFGAMAIMIAVKVSGYATNDPSPVFGGLLFLLFLLIGGFAVWMLLRLCLAFPVCVVEQATAWCGLKRGTGLSDGTRGRILLLYVLGVLLNQILVWVVAFPAMIVLALIPGLQGAAHSHLLGVILIIFFYGAMFVVRALTKPVYGIALTLFYFDQRIRQEGFDIEWMMQQAGMVASAKVQESVALPDISNSSEFVPETLAAVEQVVEVADNATGLREEQLASAPKEAKA
jgi:hypothetical protein